MNDNKSALEPFLKNLVNYTGEEDDYIYEQQFKDFLLRYYIGISDLRAEGPLVDCGLPRRIEKQLSLYGKILAIELTDNKIVLARLTGDLVRSFLDKKITKCDFILLDDNSQEKYQIRMIEKEEQGKKVKKLVVYNSRNEEDLTIDPKKIVLFLNNDDGLPDQLGIEFWIERLKKRLDYIDYDAKKCRKKLAVISKTKMDNLDKQDAINEYENNDFLFNIHFQSSTKGKGKKLGIDPKETNYQLTGIVDSKERSQLWQDYREYLIEACKFNGLVFQASFKQERQNIPETLMAEAPYKAWEKERKSCREESYRQCEELKWIKPKWELNYGAQAETNEQKIKKLEEQLKIAELEEKIANIGKNNVEKEKEVENESKIIYDKKN